MGKSRDPHGVTPGPRAKDRWGTHGVVTLDLGAPCGRRPNAAQVLGRSCPGGCGPPFAVSARHNPATHGECTRPV